MATLVSRFVRWLERFKPGYYCLFNYLDGQKRYLVCSGPYRSSQDPLAGLDLAAVDSWVEYRFFAPNYRRMTTLPLKYDVSLVDVKALSKTARELMGRVPFVGILVAVMDGLIAEREGQQYSPLAEGSSDAWFVYCKHRE